MSDYDILATEQMYNEYALDGEMYLHQEHLDAIAYIEEFGEIIQREEEYADLIEAENKIVEYREVYVEYEKKPSNELREEIERMGEVLIQLSNQLKEQAKAIPASEKKLINRKEFEELYSIQEETQRILRNRMNDPLPYIQVVAKGNIYYSPKEVDKWLENYKKERK